LSVGIPVIKTKEGTGPRFRSRPSDSVLALAFLASTGSDAYAFVYALATDASTGTASGTARSYA
jgi:hypothetical protein